MRDSVSVASGLICVMLGVSCTCTPSTAPASELPKSQEAASPSDQAKARRSRPSSELNRESPIGSNVATVVDHSVDMPFVDLFKSARRWLSGSSEAWHDKRTLDVDENGWVRSLKPDQIARTLMLTKGGHPGGEFIVLYDGQGEIKYLNEFISDRSRPGRHLIRVKKDGPVIVNIKKTRSDDPIRNIRVLPPGGSCAEDDARWCDPSHPCPSGDCLPFEQTYEERIFHPKFLASMSRYAVLRFMDWMRTNDSTIRVWSDRPKLSDATWSQRGVPIEVIVSLCTRLRAEPWVNIPHLADDEYVRQLASAVREKLPEEFRVWVEYSNEVWNGQFKQYEEVGRCASATGKKEFGAAMICYSERADQVFRTWRAAFGESASRVVRVVGSQAVNPWVSKNILKHAKLYERADALAIAPYFGFIARRKNEAERARLSVDELLSRTEREILPKAIEHIKAQAEVAEGYGLDLVAYEGGQHYSAAGGVENNEKITALFDAINRHPRMKDLYLRYLEAWSQSGGRLFMHYNNVGAYTKWGRWGLKEYIDQPRLDAPKYDAVMEFIEQTPRWW